MKNAESLVKACRRAWEGIGRGKLLLCVSGGADSTALLLACVEAGIPAEIAHCNFNLRGAESLRDRDFVKSLCEKHHLPLHIREFDVAASAVKGESTEMTCRRIRYEFFRELREKQSFARIVVAHNQDDNIETFFLNALRGSGSRGLKGMDYDSGEILRPLLDFNRREILDFLEARNQDFVTDSSNLESENYRRNFLRNEVFPLLESRWEGFKTAVAGTMSIQSHENRIIRHFIKEALEGCDRILPWETLEAFPDPETLIYHFIAPAGGSSVIAAEMAKSARHPRVGKAWRLSGKFSAVFTKKGILKSSYIQEGENPDALYVWKKLENDATLFQKIKGAPLSELYVPFAPENYKWRNADREMKIKPLGMNGMQSVWKVLKDAGITAGERDRFPVLCDKKSGEPIWIPGIKRAGMHLVDAEADHAYHVSKGGIIQ